MIVTVTPNPGLDRTIEVPHLQRGELHRVRRATVEPGGKGINVARVLAANGVATRAVFPAGGPEGDALVAMLAPLFDAVAVPIASPLRVNVAVVEAGGAVTKLNEEGPELSAADADALLAAVESAAHGADWVVSCGSLPRGVPVHFHADIVAVAHAAGARAAVDASGEAFTAALSAGPDLVKPNREELEEAVGWPIETYGEALRAARGLVHAGARRVLASFGGAGALLVSAAAALHGVARCGEVRSTVGAGDALLAGFIAAGDDDVRSLGQAVEWAARAVATPGNGVLTELEMLVPAAVVTAEITAGRLLSEPPSGESLLVGDGGASVEGLAPAHEE